MKTMRWLILLSISLILVMICTCAVAYETGDDYPEKYKARALNSGFDDYNFAIRSCTSFVAWCLNSRNGVAFTNQYGGVDYWGNAGNWAGVARHLGIRVDSTPAVGAVAYIASRETEHVGWVKEVNGTQVVTEEYNHNHDGLFHTQTKESSYWDGYIHIADIPQGKAVTISVVGHGSVDGLVSGTGVPEGNSVTLTAVPQENYAFSNWRISYEGSLSLLPSITSQKNPLTFTMPACGVKVCAEFKRLPSSTVWDWQSLSVKAVTDTDASVGAEFYYGLPLAKMTSSLSGKFYLFIGTDQAAVAAAAPGAAAGVTAISLGKKEGVSFNFVDYNFSLSVPSVGLASIASSPMHPLLLKPGTTFYYKWTAVIDSVNLHSPVASGRTKPGSSSWSNLQTNTYGLFNGQVNWSRDLVMQEAGCFVSSDYNTVSAATRDNPGGAAVRKDIGTFPTSSSLSTADTYGCIVYYKGPSFDTIASFASGVTYYYKFYSLTSDGKVNYSDIAQYTPQAQTSSEGLSSVWMLPGDNRTVTAGSSLTVEFGSNVAATFYAHICDRSTNVDTCELVARNTTSGTATYTFNSVGNYYIYIGAAHRLGNMASNVIYIDVVPADQEKPQVTGWIDHITHEGYDICVNAWDNTGVSEIQIGTWHDRMSIDNAVWQSNTQIGGEQVVFHVSTADLGDEMQTWYHTNIYALDAAGNRSEAYSCDVYLEDTPPVFTQGWIENYTANGFDVVAFGEDEHELAYFVFGVWHDQMTIDTAQWFTVMQEEGSASLRVSTDSFDGVSDTTYHVMIIPFDSCNNAGAEAQGDVYLDATPPELTDVYGEVELYEGYDVVCNATDDIGVVYYAFGTWNDQSDISSALWEFVSADEGNARYTVRFDRFGMETGVTYHTIVIPYDICNNQGEAVTLDVEVPLRDIYAEKDEAFTMYLPDGTVEIEEEAFAGISARFFILPSTVRSIGRLAFPEGSVVYVYNAAKISIPKDVIANWGTIVEMTSSFDRSLYNQLSGTGIKYMFRNGKVVEGGGLLMEEE